ncbi:MAG: hypothetical protein LC135_16550 [Phycisphaerae bacterium]|nr:hypothetical protein [Phycisphaerae bacterium]MCZ2401450.1 hypothetical protein [Phycisphaerae bacterium]NUQ50149.1 hypothetical protein [Phycisphaerae bacterium]
MAKSDQPPRELRIKKYSNRRFYDTTRSCHVTLGELHDLICAGHEVTVTDSKSGEDITHLVLTQILLERDAPKLNIFPANILHDVIRTQQELLGGVVERFFRQALDAHRASHERWSSFLRNVLGANPMMPTTPLDWTRAMMDAFAGAAGGPSSPGANDQRRATDDKRAAQDEPRSAPSESRDAELAELRRRLADLTRKVEALNDKPRSRK